MADILLEVNNLKKYFITKKGWLHAVDGVSFTIEQGKTLGLVGESGCGKSTTGRAILRLLEPTSGEILFEGKSVTNLDRRQMRAMRKNMQIIFQDPYSSLDPRMSVSEIIREPIIRNNILTDKKQIKNRVLDLMAIVGLSEKLFNTYPHELDGGRRQRIGVARALAMEPKFIVCDEPVSALDVSIQAQIINLLMELEKEFRLTYIFITHDLSVVYHLSDDIAVMYLGKLVEKAPANELFTNALHPYTKALLSAVPNPDPNVKQNMILLKGELSSPINLPNGCRFAKRCFCAINDCYQCDPPLIEISPSHFVACHHHISKEKTTQ